MKDDDKKVYSAIGNWFKKISPRICQSLYDVKPKAQSELCAQLAIRFLIANVRDGSVTLKGSHRMRDGQIFLKNLRAPLLNEHLSNEFNFDRMRLAGLYL